MRNLLPRVMSVKHYSTWIGPETSGDISPALFTPWATADEVPEPSHEIVVPWIF